MTRARSLILGPALGCVILVGTFFSAVRQVDRHGVRLAQTAGNFGVLGGVLVVLTVTVTVTLMRAAPMVALGAAVVLVDAYLLLRFSFGPIQLCTVVAMYQVARRRAFPVSLVACGIAAVITSTVVYVRLAHELELPWVLALAWMGWLVVPWLLGALVQTAAISREHTRRDLIARGAMAERVKLAAEVHDVAGHGFALVAMQAGVALLDFDERPGQARRSLEAIRTTSSRSLTALRTMLDTFHNDTPASDTPSTDTPSTDTPAPGKLEDPAPDRAGLAGIVELVDEVRASGLPVGLEIRGVDRALGTETDAVAYRVIQESLTNVVRHARPAMADVSIEQHEDWLVVRVEDRGRRVTGEPRGAARGLAGMRRRVEAAGGRFAAGPRDDGGFRVRACLPNGRDRDD